MTAIFLMPCLFMYASSNGMTRLFDHGVWKTSGSKFAVMALPPAIETCGMPALSTSPRMAIVWPVPVAPMMATTLSWSMSLVAAATALASSVASSSMMTSICLPLMPPASLMRLTSISSVFFSGAPSPAYVPVRETTAPILMVSAAATTSPRARGGRTAARAPDQGDRERSCQRRLQHRQTHLQSTPTHVLTSLFPRALRLFRCAQSPPESRAERASPRAGRPRGRYQRR